MMESQKKKLAVAGLVVVALIVVVIGGYQAWLRVPPSMPGDVDDLESLMASARYHRLSAEDKRPYLERINEMYGQLSREDRERYRAFLRDNGDALKEEQKRREVMLRSMYTNMILNQGEANRDIMLDTVINQMETPAAREQRAKMSDRSNRTPESREQEDEAIRQMWKWLDSGDPQAIGYGSEFFKLLQQRREERGLPPL